MTRLLPLALVVLFAFRSAAAPLPIQIRQSGYLLAANDTPLTATGQAVSFTFYDAATGGSAVWTATCAVDVAAGYFAITLGAPSCGPALDTGHLPVGASRWLGIAVGPVDLDPRIALQPAPTATLAAEATHAADADTLGGVAANLYQLKSETPSYTADGATLQLSTGTFSVKPGGLGATHLASDAGGLAKVSGGVLASASGDITSIGSITVSGIGKKFLGNGSGLTNLDAGAITTGTLGLGVIPSIPDTKLASNGDLAKLSAAQTITGITTFHPGSGTAPFAVDSTRTGVVANLNADQVDGVHMPSLPFACSGGQTVSGFTSAGGVLTPTCSTPSVGGTVITSATEPTCSGAQAGNIYFNTVDNAFYGCNTVRWQPLYGVSDGSTARRAAASCRQLHLDAPWLASGPYLIDPNGAPSSDAFLVYCDMVNAGGGWTRIANVQGEVGICSYVSGFGTPNDVVNDTGTTGAYPAASITSWNLMTDKQLMVMMPGNASNTGNAVFTSSNAIFTWANIASGTLNTMNVGSYAVTVSFSGAAPVTVTNGLGCNANSGCLFGSYFSGTNWTPILGIGSYARGSFTQDASCVSSAATNAYKGAYTGTQYLPTGTWNNRAWIYLR